MIAVDDLVRETVDIVTSPLELGPSYHPVEVRKPEALSHECLGRIKYVTEG